MITKNRQTQRNVIEDFLQPGLTGYRERLRADGKEVKNHMQQHREALKKTAETNWKKKEEARTPNQAAFKLKKFTNIQSKVREDIQHQIANEDLRGETG